MTQTRDLPQKRADRPTGVGEDPGAAIDGRGQLDSVQQIARLGSWEWEIPTNSMVWSDEMFRICGHEPDTFVPTFDALVEHVHPEDRPWVERRLTDALLSPACLEFDCTLLRPDGSGRSVHCRTEIVVGEDGQPARMIGTAQDVTESRSLTRSLSTQVEQLQQLAQVSVMIYSAESLQETLEVATGHALRMVGARRARGSIADPRRPGETLVHLLASPELDDAASHLVAAVEPLHHPVRVARGEVDRMRALEGLSDSDRALANSGWLVVPLVDLLGGATGAIQLFEKRNGDFSEADEALVMQIAQITSLALQKARLFEELQASEDRYRRLFDAHLSGDFVISEDGTLLEVNPAFARILGRPSVRDLRGVNVAEIYRNPKELHRILDRIRLDGRALQQETELLRVDGSPVFVIINLVGVRDWEGDLVGFQGCLFDVTEWKKAEAALRESQQQLLQAQKMEAVGQLAGGIAHDFNNMLMAIQGFANLLEEEIAPTPTALAHLAEIRKAADRSARLTRQLLAYSRKQVLQPEVIQLNGIVSGMEDMLRRLIGEHILFECALGPEAGRVHADPGQLQQVLMNLVLNARDAMSSGGRLVVRTSTVQIDHPMEMNGFTLPPDDYSVLAVSDTGSGIPAAILPRIFEPFFTTKAVGVGSGLGLSTVYGIVKQSGGYIQATSVVGEGSSFVIYLPRTSTAATPSVPTPAAEATASASGATVLVAEDESVLRSLASLVLRRAGFRVIEAEDGMEALRLAAEIDYAIDLLVTDLVMPRLGGEILATTLLDHHPGLKIVFMSGYAEDVVARQGLIVAAGSRFLEKPFPPQLLVRTVRELLPASATVTGQ